MKWYIPYNDIIQKTQQGAFKICEGAFEICEGAFKICVDDAQVWSVPMAEFHLDCRVESPLCAQLTLISVRPETGGAHSDLVGVIVQGTLTGRVIQACDLCAEDAPVDIKHTFEVFETVPTKDMWTGGHSSPSAHSRADFFAANVDGDDDDNQSHFIYHNSALVLDLAALCWEEFMLALPMRPLCVRSCKGLCPQCGTNLNIGTCACKDETGDPRLAALRALKIQS